MVVAVAADAVAAHLKAAAQHAVAVESNTRLAAIPTKNGS